jgi:hypothetical protein
MLAARDGVVVGPHQGRQRPLPALEKLQSSPFVVYNLFQLASRRALNPARNCNSSTDCLCGCSERKKIRTKEGNHLTWYMLNSNFTYPHFGIVTSLQRRAQVA